MITNLRYHVDGEHILVRWNYEDVDRNLVKATCRLVKRINDEVVSERTDINWNTYHYNGGGWIFDMPDYPVRIEVFQQLAHHVSEVLSMDVVEAPHYQIKASVNMTPITMYKDERAWLWRRRTRRPIWDHVEA